MKELKDKSFDLCFTDPPFNIDLANNVNDGVKRKDNSIKDKEIFYNDNREDYRDWCKNWFKEVMRICKKVMIHCGNENLNMWYRISDPIDQIIHFIPFNTIITPVAWAGRFRPILVYADTRGEFYGNNKKRKLNTNVFIKPFKNKEQDKMFIHPCPLDVKLVYDILQQLKPDNVLDPFLGSGTISQVAEELNVKWLGYEINEAYRPDIEKRIVIGQSKREKKNVQMKVI